MKVTLHLVDGRREVRDWPDGEDTLNVLIGTDAGVQDLNDDDPMVFVSQGSTGVFVRQGEHAYEVRRDYTWDNPVGPSISFAQHVLDQRNRKDRDSESTSPGFIALLQTEAIASRDSGGGSASGMSSPGVEPPAGSEGLRGTITAIEVAAMLPSKLELSSDQCRLLAEHLRATGPKTGES